MNKQNRKSTKKKKPISAEQIARMADRGEDISRFFTGKLMMAPIQMVNLDFTGEMLERLAAEAARLNISRQAVIKTLVREGLDRRHPRQARATTSAQKNQGKR
ncbi:MAG TPA: hypothetical protein VJX70_11800 [Candidatus Acidoferrum sp.]|nr:hypothetical protein [Candidatus Acidoferrum sp.]